MDVRDLARFAATACKSSLNDPRSCRGRHPNPAIVDSHSRDEYESKKAKKLKAKDAPTTLDKMEIIPSINLK